MSHGPVQQNVHEMRVFFITPLKSASTNIKMNRGRTVTGCRKTRRERCNSTEWGYGQKGYFREHGNEHSGSKRGGEFRT
jgi:ribosomal protein L4